MNGNAAADTILIATQDEQRSFIPAMAMQEVLHRHRHPSRYLGAPGANTQIIDLGGHTIILD
jgi:hypothetical protein